MKTPKRLELVAFGEPSDVIELNTVFEPVLGQEDAINPSDFLLVRGISGDAFWSIDPEAAQDQMIQLLTKHQKNFIALRKAIAH